MVKYYPIWYILVRYNVTEKNKDDISHRAHMSLRQTEPVVTASAVTEKPEFDIKEILKKLPKITLKQKIKILKIETVVYQGNSVGEE